MDLQNDMLAYFGQTSTKPRTPKRLLYGAPVAPKVDPTPRPQSVPAKPAPPAPSGLLLVPYSDRSFAIFGDTKPLAAQLGELGGTFNRFLKKDGAATPGWIFSNKRLDNVRKALSI